MTHFLVRTMKLLDNPLMLASAEWSQTGQVCLMYTKNITLLTVLEETAQLLLAQHCPTS